jgi:hypothetical protein
VLLQASDRPAEWLGLPPTGRSLTNSSQAIRAVKRAVSSGGRAAGNAWTEARCAAGLAVLENAERRVSNDEGQAAAAAGRPRKRRAPNKERGTMNDER